MVSERSSHKGMVRKAACALFCPPTRPMFAVAALGRILLRQGPEQPRAQRCRPEAFPLAGSTAIGQLTCPEIARDPAAVGPAGVAFLIHRRPPSSATAPGRDTAGTRHHRLTENRGLGWVNKVELRNKHRINAKNCEITRNRHSHQHSHRPDSHSTLDPSFHPLSFMFLINVIYSSPSLPPFLHTSLLPPLLRPKPFSVLYNLAQ